MIGLNPVSKRTCRARVVLWGGPEPTVFKEGCTFGFRQVNLRE